MNTNDNTQDPQYKRKRRLLQMVWARMRRSCLNPNCKEYKTYGGAGVTIQESWVNNSEAFVQWSLANGYDIGLQIDRTVEGGNYEEGNVSFIPSAANSRKQLTVKRYTFEGENLCLGEIIERVHGAYSHNEYCRIAYRVNRGMDIRAAITAVLG